MEHIERCRTWVERYVVAWNSNEPDDISGLFTENATYFMSPNEPPIEGRHDIVEQWIDNKDEPGSTTFEFEVLIANEGLGIVKGIARYPDDVVYDDLWEIWFEGDRCHRFVEWWMKS